MQALTPAPDLDGWAVVERLLADVAPLTEPLWLVVDDVHELGAEALRQLELLLMRAPPQLRFVLATRHDVRLGLHRLRLEGELAEIREPDLRFSLAEAGSYSPRRGWSCPVRRWRCCGSGRRGGQRGSAGCAVAGRAPGSGAVRGRVLRELSERWRVPAGRSAEPAARGCTGSPTSPSRSATSSPSSAGT